MQDISLEAFRVADKIQMILIKHKRLTNPEYNTWNTYHIFCINGRFQGLWKSYSVFII